MAIQVLPTIIDSPLIVRGAVIQSATVGATLYLAELELLGTITRHRAAAATLGVIDWKSNDYPDGLRFGTGSTVSNVLTSTSGLAVNSNRSITSAATRRTTPETETFSNLPARQTYFKITRSISLITSVTVNGTATTAFNYNPALGHVQLLAGVPEGATVVIVYDTDNIYHVDYAITGSVLNPNFPVGDSIYRLRGTGSLTHATADKIITLSGASGAATTGYPIEIPGPVYAYNGPTATANSLAGLFI